MGVEGWSTAVDTAVAGLWSSVMRPVDEASGIIEPAS